MKSPVNQNQKVRKWNRLSSRLSNMVQGMYSGLNDILTLDKVLSKPAFDVSYVYAVHHTSTTLSVKGRCRVRALIEGSSSMNFNF
jgi:hypothetical protein